MRACRQACLCCCWVRTFAALIGNDKRLKVLREALNEVWAEQVPVWHLDLLRLMCLRTQKYAQHEVMREAFSGKYCETQQSTGPRMRRHVHDVCSQKQNLNLSRDAITPTESMLHFVVNRIPHSAVFQRIREGVIEISAMTERLHVVGIDNILLIDKR